MNFVVWVGDAAGEVVGGTADSGERAFTVSDAVHLISMLNNHDPFSERR
jgi:hypothetical protein